VEGLVSGSDPSTDSSVLRCAMIFKETRLQGAFLIELEKREDERGFFARVCCQDEFAAHGLRSHFVQCNTAYSKTRGTLRGLHYQVPPHEEAKLIHCTMGAIYDVLLDLRPASPTYKEWLAVELTSRNGRLVYVPEGCAHGYQTLEDHTQVLYPVSAAYCAEAERGVRWDDPVFGIEWPPVERRVLSPKDASWPDYDEVSR